MEAIEVIDKFGGIRPMAKVLGYPTSTVQNWKERKRIPFAQFPAILEAAKKEGVDLTLEKLANIKFNPKRKVKTKQ